jgi:hypothetical protein
MGTMTLWSIVFCNGLFNRNHELYVGDEFDSDGFLSTNLLRCMKFGSMRLAVAKGKRIYFGHIVEMRILCTHNVEILVRGLVQPLV